MVASLEKVIQALGQPTPPHRITQWAFDYDSSHYRRLCHLQGADPGGADLYSYANDMEYMPLQPELLRYLLPICLKAWHDDLLNMRHSGHAGFVEAFWTALSPRSQSQDTFVLEEELNAKERESVMQFMRDSLLDRMDQETKLHFVGSNASAYQWFSAIGSFSMVFPNLKELWEIWWNMKTFGHAVCALQYLSCLMYWDEGNPIFEPWTQAGGGGPPALWENESFDYEHGWRQENSSFLSEVLTLDYVNKKLHQAAQVVNASREEAIPIKMLADWPQCCDLVASRMAELPKLVAQSPLACPEWSV
jgi:hypothetical protein